MAVIKRVRRLANPYRKRRTANPRRRKLTAKQKLHFGTKRQRAAAKLALRGRRRVANPKRRKRTAAVSRKRRTSRNPALVVTLGAVNPTRRRNKMATRRKRKATPRRHRRITARAANPQPRVHRRRRVARRNPARRIRRARRNPVNIFGARGSKDVLSMVGGGLVGVAAAKLVPRFIPATLTAGLGNWGGLLLTGASAWAAGWAASRFVSPTFGSAVLFGGLMQTGSVALNMFVPGLGFGGVNLALSGMGDLVPGQFVVPQNPLRLPPPPAASPTPRVNMNGLSRVYGQAF